MLRPKKRIMRHKSQPRPVLSGQLTVMTVVSPSFSASRIITTSSCRIPIIYFFFLCFTTVRLLHTTSFSTSVLPLLLLYREREWDTEIGLWMPLFLLVERGSGFWLMNWMEKENEITLMAFALSQITHTSFTESKCLLNMFKNTFCTHLRRQGRVYSLRNLCYCFVLFDTTTLKQIYLYYYFQKYLYYYS